MLEPNLAYINPIYIIKETTSMDKIIHSYTNTMDKKWIFLLIKNIDISDKLCRHLVEIEKPSHPTGGDMIGANLENTLKSIHGNFSR